MRASSGSSIIVHSSCPQREIKLKTYLQAVAVSVTLEKEITLCYVYIPPSFAKPAYIQYNVEDAKITESSKFIVAKSQKQSSQSTLSSKTSAQPQAGSQNKTYLSSTKPSSGQPNA